MSDVEALLEKTFFHNTLWQWALAAGIVVVVFFVALIVRRVIRAHYAHAAATQQFELMELPLKVASRTSVLFLLIAALFAGLQSLDLPQKPDRLFLTIMTIAAFWQVGVWVSSAVETWLEHKQRQALERDRAAAGSFGIIAFVARALIWALVLLLTLDNLGIDITALVAGLGIGGIAVALAVQNVLGDLFASLSITLDRPFVVGDAVAIGDFNGTVEQIGIKSVRLRSINGEQIVMSNADMLSSRLRNYGRMNDRRSVFTINLALDSRPERLKKVPAGIRAIIEAEQNVRFDRSHFARIGAGSLEFESVYIVTTADYARYIAIQQSINLQIIELLEREGLELAVPVQRVLREVSGESVAAEPAKPA